MASNPYLISESLISSYLFKFLILFIMESTTILFTLSPGNKRVSQNIFIDNFYV